MPIVRDGFGVSEGIVEGKIHLLSWGIPEVVHRRVEADLVEDEVALFEKAREETRGRLKELREATAKRAGTMEARVFDPQILMLDDPEVVDRTIEYIRGNHLTAAQAFEWRILELQAMWSTYLQSHGPGSPQRSGGSPYPASQSDPGCSGSLGPSQIRTIRSSSSLRI